MSSRNAGSLSSRKQYAVRELRSKAPALDDLKFNTQLRAQDSLTSKKPVLFLPASKRECDLLRRAWPSHNNAFDSAFALKLYSDPEPTTFPNSPAPGYKSQIPETFYPELLVQFVEDFSRGAVCREEGSTLYRALIVVQDALADVMVGPKAKTKDALLSMLKEPMVTSALGYYRIFWHKTRCCPLFALRFICLFCDFCEKVLTKAEYASKVYNEDTRRGLGVDKTLRNQTRAIKGPSHNVVSLAIPLPLDPSTYEGQLLITIAQAGVASNVLHHPVTGAVLLPDPSGIADLPPASPLLNALEDDDFENEGPASPVDKNDGPASPALDLGGEDDGETEASDDTDIKDVSGLDANVVLTAWAKEHPNEKLSYDDATLFATFFNWNSSCNLSTYLENPEEIEKFRQFLKDHKLESPSDPSTSGEAASAPVDSPVEEPKKTYSAMHASNWNVEAAAKPDEPATPITEEQKP
ncbi:hypothetical protein F5878DRAFT_674220 [Lentinula raphanica]|uniref:Uncharacterized protein n=1 Tax=Lentinula raphanica TaxID=153919 RepID=A0AA38NVW1_9AGAR|nr:hypothetical protein F5878DRAFT_674220 [Lentinula raphanica]